MVKELVRLIVDLIFQPTDTWKRLSEKEMDHAVFMKKILYPMIILLTVTAFAGVLFTRKEFDFELAIKSAILAFLTFYGGFYLAVYVLNEVLVKFLKLPKDIKLYARFVGFSSLLMYTIYILLKLIPQFFFLSIFYLYTVYIVWEGAGPYLKISENERLKFTVISTATILLVPFLIDLILLFLMPGFRF